MTKSEKPAACRRFHFGYDQRRASILSWNSQNQNFRDMFSNLPWFEIDDSEYLAAQERLGRIVGSLGDAASGSKLRAEIDR